MLSQSTEITADSRWLRSAMDLSVCFVITVIMLRTFVLEGYLISTGSMAPGLLGFHRRIQCPECQFDFAFGVSFDESTVNGDVAFVEPTGLKRYATCPNCGRNRIDVSAVPNSHGDQLLVQKHVYDLRRPGRWETVVFRNPSSPDQAYVKRVVGLPGERIQIVNGDVWINGALARKTWEQQLATRIPVSTLSCIPESPDWQLPWDLDEGWIASQGVLSCRSSLLIQKEAESSDRISEETSSKKTAESPRISDFETPNLIQWIRFRYWRWFGGEHSSETPLAADVAHMDWQRFSERLGDLPIMVHAGVEYDPQRQVLRCRGVMSEETQNSLLRSATTEEFRNAVFRLAALSHGAPVTDRYGYNTLVSSPEYAVRDLMVNAVLEWPEGPGPDSVHVRIPVGAETFGLILRIPERSVELVSLDERIRIAAAELPESAGSTARKLELCVSTIDRQVTVALNGFPCFAPHECVVSPGEEPLEASVSVIGGKGIDPDRAARIAMVVEQQNRWAIGVSGGDVRLTELSVWRDVFYTPGKRKNGIDSEFLIPADSYFVQGDNSPVSSDSRSWEAPCVPHRLLVGKPFLVHLPSRPAFLRVGKYQWPVRIPEWSRIRYIR